MRKTIYQSLLVMLFTPLTLEAKVTDIVNQVCNKNIVILAELPSHGELRTFQTKADLVQRLVLECGFNKIHFEAPIYEFIELQLLTTNNQASPKHLDDALGGFWTPTELEAWRKWLFAQAQTNQLKLVGLDDQISASSHLTRKQLPELFQKHLPQASLKKCQTVLKRDLFWLYDANNPYNKEAHKKVLQCVKSAKNFATSTNNGVTKDSTDSVKLKNLENLYLRSINSKKNNNRDQRMYKNFKWHHEAEDKHIIWTSTVHATKQAITSSYTPLGTYLNQEYQNQLAVIGFTAYTGMSSRAGNKPQVIETAPDDSLEALIVNTKDDMMYLNNTTLKEKKLMKSRLHGSFTQENWHQLYDGVILFRNERAPTFNKK